MTAWDKFRDFVQTEKFQEGFDLFLQTLKEISPEAEKWLENHWENQWGLGGDRWNERNRQEGWDLD